MDTLGVVGGEPGATVLLSWREEWRIARSERERKVPNRGQFVLEDLAPGTYQVERLKTVQVAEAKRSPRLEPLMVVVESGKSSEVALARQTGAAVEGEIIGLEKLKLPGALIDVVKPESLDFIMLSKRVDEAVEALTCDATGRFKTPRLPPGTYSIVAEGYKPRTPEHRFNRTWPAAYRVSGTVTVPERGPAPRVRIVMPAPPDGDTTAGVGAASAK